MTIREIEEKGSHNWEEGVNWQYVKDRLNLALTGKKIRTLPDCVRNVKGLEILTLVDTKLACLPESIGELSNLQRLNLHDNQLKALPESLGNLSQLRYVNLSDNNLCSLPDNIGKLESLEEFNLSDNELSHLPDSMGNLKNIRELNLSNNRLSRLPESICELEHIERLDISHNQIKTLPDSFQQLSKLNYFTLDVLAIANLKKPLNHYTTSDILFQIDGIYVDPPEQCLDQAFSEWKEEWLLEFSNVEHRMMLVKVLGYERIMKKLGSVTLHKELDSFGNEMELHKIELSSKVKSGEEPEEDIVLLKVVCPSTGKIHILRVPPDMTNCEKARRWTLFDEKIEMRFVDET
ncbi:MAG: leucine-rich repeat domain-containing protein [Spirochaetota bacterium]|nr:leucine-rich repeat domain-containing protein [Spirochaetota bacterium]